MALTDDNGMVMPVSPYNSNNGGGFGNFGGDWGWIILLLLFAGGGWGNGFGGFGGGNELYPWMNQAEITTNGFQNQLLNDNVSSIRDGVSNLATQLCNCCSDMQMTVQNGFAQAEIADNSRQMANMQQMFGLSQQFADCCCENRLANCQTQNIIQNEGSLTRQNATNNTQAILDKLCQLELDGKQDRINDLERQLTMANLSASQIEQTAELERNNQLQSDLFYQRLKDCPVPAQAVYGSQPVFTCPNQNNGCGCGCGNNF